MYNRTDIYTYIYAVRYSVRKQLDLTSHVCDWRERCCENSRTG